MIHIFPIELQFLTSASARLIAGRNDGDFGVYDFIFYTVLENLTVMSRANQEYIHLTRRDKSAELLEKSIFGMWSFNNPVEKKSTHDTEIISVIWHGKTESANRWALALKADEEIEQFEIIVPDDGPVIWDAEMLEQKFRLDPKSREELAHWLGLFNAAQIFKGHPSPFVLRL
ncbi:MAG: hypothetical protein KIT34_16590 [Cyanobacteria bacterium TGS_CYA1]|nr:hypothetical protein [Cyanobacteria bacterium TGS_CYA1]